MTKTAPPTEPAPQRDDRLHHHGLGWRYVLVEIGIVTAGLFIALMLNSVVEWVHHKQLVRDARQNIQLEIAQNRQKIRTDMALMRISLAAVTANIVTLQQIRAGKAHHATLENRIDFDPLDDAAWQTARNTDALSYMPYDEAQRYSALYSLIAYVNNLALGELADDQLNAEAPALMGYDMLRIPPEQMADMLRNNARAKVRVTLLMQVLPQVDAELAKDSCGSEGKQTRMDRPFSRLASPQGPC
jgi:hypothetical protein